MPLGSEDGVVASLAEIDVVILAGGLGTRLAAVLRGKPKILAPLAGKPVLDHLLARLRQQGARRVLLALGHLADAVRRHVEGGVEGLDLVLSIEPEPLGTAGAIAHASSQRRSRYLLAMNGDTLIDADLSAFARWATAEASDAALITTQIERPDRYGVLTLSPDDWIEAFDEKSGAGSTAWINAGVYWLGPQILGRIAELGRGSLERDVFERLPPRSLRAYRQSGRFVDIGTPGSFADASRLFAESDVGTETARS